MRGLRFQGEVMTVLDDLERLARVSGHVFVDGDDQSRECICSERLYNLYGHAWNCPQVEENRKD